MGARSDLGQRTRQRLWPAIFKNAVPGPMPLFAGAKQRPGTRPLNMPPAFLNVCLSAPAMRWGFDGPRHLIPQKNKAHYCVNCAVRRRAGGMSRLLGRLVCGVAGVFLVLG